MTGGRSPHRRAGPGVRPSRGPARHRERGGTAAVAAAGSGTGSGTGAGTGSGAATGTGTAAAAGRPRSRPRGRAEAWRPGTAAYTRGVGWMEEEIAARGGAVPFRDFMELALYHPRHGYYTGGAVRTGRGGDYLTAPTASGWYAAVLARVAARLVRRLGAPLTVVDIASGTGAFLADLLAAWEAAGGDPAALRAVSVERSPALRQLQRSRLGGRVTIAADLDAAGTLEPPVLLHASELYDALPVHRVIGRDDGPRELWVRLGDGGLAWEERPAGPELLAYLERHGVRLEPGQVAELSLEAAPLHRSLLGATPPPAVAVILDYGYPAARLYDPRGRRSGSLACYRGHRLSRDPLQAPGKQDITAHVNWDDLRLAAAEAGWEEVALLPLAELMVRGGLAELVEAAGLGMERDLDAESVRQRQELKRLLDPDGMGTDLRALVQATPHARAAALAVLGL